MGLHILTRWYYIFEIPRKTPCNVKWNRKRIGEFNSCLSSLRDIPFTYFLHTLKLYILLRTFYFLILFFFFIIFIFWSSFVKTSCHFQYRPYTGQYHPQFHFELSRKNFQRIYSKNFLTSFIAYTRDQSLLISKLNL